MAKKDTHRPYQITVSLDDVEWSALRERSKLTGLAPGDLVRQDIRAADPDKARRQSWLLNMPTSSPTTIEDLFVEEEPA